MIGRRCPAPPGSALGSHGEVVLRQRSLPQLSRGFLDLPALRSRTALLQRVCRIPARRQHGAVPTAATSRAPKDELDHRDRQREYRLSANPSPRDGSRFRFDLFLRQHARVGCEISRTATGGFGRRFEPTLSVASRAAGHRGSRIHRSFAVLLRTKGPFRRSVSPISHDLGRRSMISPETRMQIRHCFFAEHWKIGTIARELGIHPDAVRNAIEVDPLYRHANPACRASTDPYIEFIRQTLDQHPRLRATRIYQMIRERGYQRQRRAVAARRGQLAPACAANRFCACRRFPPSKRKSTGHTSAKSGWAAPAGALSCFVITLSYSRALVSGVLLRSNHGKLLCAATCTPFKAWSGQPRVILS